MSDPTAAFYEEAVVLVLKRLGMEEGDLLAAMLDHPEREHRQIPRDPEAAAQAIHAAWRSNLVQKGPGDQRYRLTGRWPPAAYDSKAEAQAEHLRHLETQAALRRRAG